MANNWRVILILLLFASGISAQSGLMVGQLASLNTDAPDPDPEPVDTPACATFPGGRIAMSVDGNVHDVDDWGATPMAMAMLSWAGLNDQLVFVGHSNHWRIEDGLESEDSTGQYENELGTYGAAYRFNLDSSIIHNYRTDYVANGNIDSISAILAGHINSSTADDPLWIYAGGPMDAVYRGINAADSIKRQYVHVISHSAWNEDHVYSNMDKNFSSLLTDFAPHGVTFDTIQDQNFSNGNNDFQGPLGLWDWMLTDTNLVWLRDRNDTTDTQGGTLTYDVSDAGMMYWLISGGPNGGCETCGHEETEDLYLNGCDDEPIVTITSPTEGQIFETGDEVTIAATVNFFQATDSVVFSGDTSFTDVSDPYTGTYTSTQGSKQIIATAYSGIYSNSDTVNFQVNDPPDLTTPIYVSLGDDHEVCDTMGWLNQEGGFGNTANQKIADIKDSLGVSTGISLTVTSASGSGANTSSATDAALVMPECAWSTAWRVNADGDNIVYEFSGLQPSEDYEIRYTGTGPGFCDNEITYIINGTSTTFTGVQQNRQEYSSIVITATAAGILEFSITTDADGPVFIPWHRIQNVH